MLLAGSRLDLRFHSCTAKRRLLSPGNVCLHLSCRDRCRLDKKQRVISRLTLCRSSKHLVTRAASSNTRVGQAPQTSADIDRDLLSQEVSAVLPAGFDVDSRLDGEHSLQRVLDTAQVLGANNRLSRLWSDSAALALTKLAQLPLAARQPRSPASCKSNSYTERHLL